jgi:hypothetical protein
MSTVARFICLKKIKTFRFSPASAGMGRTCSQPLFIERVHPFLLQLTVCNSAINVVLPAKGDCDPKEEAVPEQYVSFPSIRLYLDLNSNINIFQVREYHQGRQACH